MKINQFTILSLLVAAASPAYAAFLDNVYNSGHADIGVALEGGTDFHLHLHAHDFGPPAVINGLALTEEEEFDAGDITIMVPFATQTIAPSNPAFNNGTGVAPGNNIWILPQGNQAGVPFMGIASEELEVADWSNITYTLGTVISPSGNGDFSLYQGDGLGGFNFFFSTENAGLTVNGNNTLVTAPGGHDHYNYSFSDNGNWLIDLTVSGTHNTLGFMSDTQTFAFNVVPEPSTYAALLGLAALGFCFARRRLKR